MDGDIAVLFGKRATCVASGYGALSCESDENAERQVLAVAVAEN